MRKFHLLFDVVIRLLLLLCKYFAVSLGVTYYVSLFFFFVRFSRVMFAVRLKCVLFSLSSLGMMMLLLLVFLARVFVMCERNKPRFGKLGWIEFQRCMRHIRYCRDINARVVWQHNTIIVFNASHVN